MGIFSRSSSLTPNVNLKELIDNGAYLVDVRTPMEFAAGHVPKSVNIPLDTVASQLKKFEGKSSVIVFCRSGNRSGQAKNILESNGITNVVNGGTWQEVKAFVS